MLGAIRYNLSNLGNFSGRDARSTFWFYVLFVMILYMLISFAAAIPMMGGAAKAAFEAAQAGADEKALEAKMFASMAGWMKITIWLSIGSTIAIILLLAASFTRRLHDSGQSGLWTALVAVIQLVALGFSVQTINRMSAMMDGGVTTETLDQFTREQATMAGYGLIGWIPTLIVIIFGVWPSSDGANKYGEEPEGF